MPFITMITSRDADFKATTVSAARELIKCELCRPWQLIGSFLIFIFDDRGFQELAPAKTKITPKHIN
jgi:hypothetical protein